jgi:predicted nucleic acid-binding protein
MKRLFLDTNILIDLLADRKPYSKFAKELFLLAEQKKVKLYTSSHSLATCYYILNKYGDDRSIRTALGHLLNMVTLVPIDSDMFKKGLQSDHKDFEDSLQVFCAYSIENIFGIVTRNIKDFKLSAVKAYAPDSILLII